MDANISSLMTEISSLKDESSSQKATLGKFKDLTTDQQSRIGSLEQKNKDQQVLTSNQQERMGSLEQRNNDRQVEIDSQQNTVNDFVTQVGSTKQPNAEHKVTMTTDGHQSAVSHLQSKVNKERNAALLYS